MSTHKKNGLINGFEPVTAADLEAFGHIAVEQASALDALFRSIARLTDDREIKDLCAHGAFQASLQSNDIDVICERAGKAGVCVDNPAS